MAKINMETLCGGAVSEMINRELATIARNISDPNTEAEKARTLTLTIRFKPDDTRRLVKAEISAKSQLAPASGMKATLLIGMDIRTGEVAVGEYDDQLAGQMVINDQMQAVDPSEQSAEQQDPPKSIRDLRKAL